MVNQKRKKCEPKVRQQYAKQNNIKARSFNYKQTRCSLDKNDKILPRHRQNIFCTYSKIIILFMNYNTDIKIRSVILEVFPKYDTYSYGTLSGQILGPFFTQVLNKLGHKIQINSIYAEKILKKVEKNYIGAATKENIFFAVKNIIQQNQSNSANNLYPNLNENNFQNQGNQWNNQNNPQNYQINPNQQWNNQQNPDNQADYQPNQWNNPKSPYQYQKGNQNNYQGNKNPWDYQNPNIPQNPNYQFNQYNQNPYQPKNYNNQWNANQQPYQQQNYNNQYNNNPYQQQNQWNNQQPQNLKFSDQQIRQLIDNLYLKYDTDRSGTLNAYELQNFFNEILKMLNIPITLNNQEALAMLNQIDRNRSGRIEKAQVFICLKNLMS